MKSGFLRTVCLMGAGMTTGMLVIAYISAGEIYDYEDTVDGVHLPDVSAVVCLAGGRGRIAAAGDLWYRYWESYQLPIPGVEVEPAPRTPPVLYISGMGPASNWTVLTRQVRRGVLEALRPSDVVLETQSTNTEENARWLVRTARERGWDRVLLVTSSYHMKRSRYMFEKILGQLDPPVKVETLSVYQEPFEPGEWRSGFHGVRITVTEYLKWVYTKAFWRP